MIQILKLSMIKWELHKVYKLIEELFILFGQLLDLLVVKY